MRAIALLGITAYQRHLSPRKGFCCAYRIRTGRGSCSTLGFRAIRRYGVRTGIGILRRRFVHCAEALQALRNMPAGSVRQQGFCDLACDLPSLDCAGDALNVAACSDLPGDCGDWGGRRKRDKPTTPDLTQPRPPNVG